MMNKTIDRENDSDFIAVGVLGRSYGVRGWIKVKSCTEPEERILDYKGLYISSRNGWLDSQVEELKYHGNQLLIKLKGCETPEMAKIYTGVEIAISQEQLPTLSQGEYYWKDLVGCTVTTLEGHPLGIVDYLIETGANDVLVVKGDRERLIPFVRDHFIQTVDITKKTITVDWDPDF